MKRMVLGFPLEPQKIQEPDGLPRAVVAVPAGSVIMYLGVLFPTDIVGVVALVPVSEETMAPDLREMNRMEFLVATPSNVIPDGFKFRAPVKTKMPPAVEGGPPQEGLIFLFEKEAPKLMIVTPGGRA